MTSSLDILEMFVTDSLHFKAIGKDVMFKITVSWKGAD